MDLITGDVHQRDYDSKEHRAFDIYEVVSEYLSIVEKDGLKCLLFVTGVCIEENPDFWTNVVKKGHRLGFHTYDSFQKFKFGQGFKNKLLFGCNYGSYNAQELDIVKCKYIANKHGFVIKDWRTHEYASNEITKELLAKHNFSAIYDRFDLSNTPIPFEVDGIKDVPITFPDDHCNVVHVVLNDKRSGLMSPEDYVSEVRKLYKHGRCNIIQCHPMCQKSIWQIFYQKILT